MTNDINPTIARLVSYWKAQGLELPGGVTEEQLRAFEAQFGVILPPDLCDYFSHVDGMGSRGMSDDDWFSFWPLAEVLRASDDSEPFIEDQSSYYLFADHSLCLPTYAIRLNPSGTGPNPVIAIFWHNGVYTSGVVARSFSQFVEKYLGDDDSRVALRVGAPVTE